MRLLPALLAAALVAACSDKAPEKKGAPPTLITTTTAQAVTLETGEATLGSLEAVLDPKVAAEVPGRVVAIGARSGQTVKKGQMLARIDPDDPRLLAQADAADASRLEALLAQQERVVARQEELVAKNFISRNALDDALAQRDALRSQLAAARSRSELSRGNLGKTTVTAPFDGSIEVQIVSVGDYVKVGDPMFRMVSNRRLRANLPFPEQVAARLRTGMPVRLSSPLAPGAVVAGEIDDIRPTTLEGSRAVEVIARIDNPGPLKGGGSVDGLVVTGRKEGAIVVPEQSVVLRPAGKVVYVVADGKAQQRPVEVGSKKEGRVEIVRGLQAGETVALDGAGFLTDGAPVAVKGAAAPARPEDGKPQPAR